MMANIKQITYPPADVVHGRSSVQIAEDQILHMMEVNKLRAYSRADAVMMQTPITRLNKSYKEWEEVIKELIDSQDNSFSWLNNVNLVYMAFCDHVRSGR